MLIIISPAKTLDVNTPPITEKTTQANLLDDAQLLISELCQLTPQDISSLMGISHTLSMLNYQRYKQWQLPFSSQNAKQALFTFKGEVYVAINPCSLGTDELLFAQKHLCILSGLYGVLRPLDLIQPYRLEMGVRFPNIRGKDLYQFWGNKITQVLNAQLKKTKTSSLVNLASTEYFRSVKTRELDADIITPVFKDEKNGQYKIISFYAKKARGLMTAYIIKHHITQITQLKHFNIDGYIYNTDLSVGNKWVFTRG